MWMKVEKMALEAKDMKRRRNGKQRGEQITPNLDNIALET
jgi:hypothetical protein